MTGPRGPDDEALHGTEPHGVDDPPVVDDVAGVRKMAASVDDRGPDGAPDPDLGRRGFLRTFTKGVVRSAGAAHGTISALNRASLEAAGAMFRPASTVTPGASEGVAPVERASSTSDSSARRPFRVQGDILVIVDERRLPDEVVEIECRSPIDLAKEIARGGLPGGPVAAQAAAMALALAAAQMRTYQPTLRRAILEVRAAVLANARPSSQQLRWAVARVMRCHEAASELDDDGDRIATAMRVEAEAIAAEADDACRRIAAIASEHLAARQLPIAILAHGGGGPLSGSGPDTYAPCLQRLERKVGGLLVYVTEGRPNRAGARVGSDLAAAGIDHVLIADLAAGWLLAAGRVDAILVGAERVAANGDTTNEVGAYALAVLAARHSVPFFVCAALASVDLDSPDRTGILADQTRNSDGAIMGGSRTTSPEIGVLNPGYDTTPHELITAIVTEQGVLRPPYAPALAAALDPNRMVP